MIINVESLLGQFETLRRLDSGFRVFGASKHRYRLNSPASLDTLHNFEKVHSVKLPSDYCQYLTEVSNGGAGPNYGLIEIERAALGHVPSLPFPIREIDGQPKDTLFESDRIPGAVWLSDNGCATFDSMVISGVLAGSVWTILDEKNEYCCSSFEKWIMGWLQSAIRTIQRESLLKTLRTGMHIDEIRGVLGHEIVPVPVEGKANGYGAAFFDCNAVFHFDSADRLLKFDHYSHIICPQVRERPEMQNKN